jgi:hypothetical protein
MFEGVGSGGLRAWPRAAGSVREVIMRRPLALLVLASTVLALGTFAGARGAGVLSPRQAATLRLVVFEAFLHGG